MFCLKKSDAGETTKEEKEAYEKLQEKFELVPKKQHKSEIKSSEKLTKEHSTKAAPEGMLTHTINILKHPRYLKTFVVSALAFGILYSFLYGLWILPVIEFGINRFSAVGITDYAYLLLISIMAGMMFALFKYEKIQSIKSGSKAGMGGTGLAGIISAICPACQGISIVALGSTVAALPLAFLVPYIGLIQLMTVLILGFALYLKANSVFTQTCITCKIGTKLTINGTTKNKGIYIRRNK